MKMKFITMTLTALLAIGLGQAQGAGAPGGNSTEPGAVPAGGAGGGGGTAGNASQDPQQYRSTPPAAGAPKSSLSPNAMTPRANQNGATLPGTVKSYSQTQSNQAPVSGNTGAINPDTPTKLSGQPSTAGTPKSSLSPNAMTPNANPNGATLPGTVKSYSQNGVAPAAPATGQ